MVIDLVGGAILGLMIEPAFDFETKLMLSLAVVEATPVPNGSVKSTFEQYSTNTETAELAFVVASSWHFPPIQIVRSFEADNRDHSKRVIDRTSRDSDDTP
jgi:hypothetical protein